MYFFHSNEKDDDDNEKKEEQGIDWEETGGSGSDKAQGPWNKTASAQPTVNFGETCKNKA